jgi:steroid delta-isomerase-like uncharacterized protein
MKPRERLMHDYLGAWNRRDADAIAAFFTEDAVYEDRGAGTVARGRDQIRAHAARVHAGFPDLHFELVRAAHGDDFTAGEWHSRMTHDGDFEGLAPSGRAVESSGVDVATIDDEDRIVHLASYYDGAAIMRALGLLPPRGSRMERVLVRAASALSSARRRVAPQDGRRTTPGSG